MRDRKGGDPDGRRSGEELGGAEGGETIIRIYCVRGKSLLKEKKRLKIKTWTPLKYT